MSGRLRLSARLHAQAALGVGIESTRPRASALLVGRRIDEALELVPTLFAVCAHAQSEAARAAMACARDGEVPVPVRGSRRQVLLEALREHLWRLLIDWPTRLRLPPQSVTFGRWYRRISGALAGGESTGLDEELADTGVERLLGMAPADWRTLRERDELRALPQFGVSDVVRVVHAHDWRCARELVDVLAPSTAADWARAFDCRLDWRLPTWHGQVRQTGAIAGHLGLPVVARLVAAGEFIAARLVARVFEVIEMIDSLRTGVIAERIHACAAGPGIGIAQVECARGLLVHRVELDGGRVARYDVVAPTEWNFHPDGAFAREAAAAGLVEPAALRGYLDALALSFDPCLPYAIDLVVANGETVPHA